MTMTLNRRTLFITAAAAGAMLSAPAFAARDKSVAAVSNGRRGESAIDGYDATAYFTRSEAGEGAEAFAHEWKGAVWRFETEEARDLFAADPEAFAPQFGGYCANAMSMGKIVPANSEIWRMKDGSLYLFAGKGGGKKFDKDADTMIEKATAFWETLTLTE